MRFVDTSKNQVKGRRSANGQLTISAEEAGTPERLAFVINQLVNRVSELESRTPPEAIEFDVACPEGGEVTINHGFTSPVRWYVTSWRRKTNAGDHNLSEVSVSTVPGKLVLYSKTPGQAVIRVEPAQAGQSLRTATTADTAQVILSATPSTTITTSTATDLTGVLVGNGTDIDAITQPAGNLVGTTATQTLSAKTITDLILNGTTAALKFSGGDAQVTIDFRLSPSLATTTATTNTIDSWTPPANCGVSVFSLIGYIRDTEATTAGYVRHGTFRVSAGTVAQVGTAGGTVVSTNEDTAGDDGLVNTDGSVIRTRGVAGAATNKRWYSFSIVVTVTHP